MVPRRRHTRSKPAQYSVINLVGNAIKFTDTG